MRDWFDFSEGDRVVIADSEDAHSREFREVWTITRVWTTGKVEMRSGMTGEIGQTHARRLIFA